MNDIVLEEIMRTEQEILSLESRIREDGERLSRLYREYLLNQDKVRYDNEILPLSRYIDENHDRHAYLVERRTNLLKQLG